MYEASSDRPQSLKSTLLLEILENGLKLGIYDKEYFMLYLEHPLKVWHMNKTRVKKDTQDFVWNGYIQNVQSRLNGVMTANLEAKMYKKYLEVFYREKGDLKEFTEFFSDSFLKALAEELYFLSGKELKNDKIDFEKYEKLANAVIIELSECNKEVFQPSEKVQIFAELKNVPTMHIKIFEFNSLNYYKKNKVPFKTDVNLDGFITAYEKDIEFDQVSAHKKFKHTFNFPELDDKIGLFVIELIGNGYSSRVIIKKGTLSVIYKQRIAGQIAYVLDDNRDVCIGEDTGIYFGNQFFKANPDKGGRILIPYEKQTVTGNAILVHNNFAQLVEFTRFAEKYTIDVAYVIPQETLIMNNQATIILRPILKVNQRKCKLEALSKTKVRITTTSFIDHVPVSKNFEDISLRSDKDLDLSFNVPPNLESVNIEFESSIFNISQQKTEKLKSSHEIKMKTNNEHFAFYESHLRKIDGKYHLKVLGKNGEPISHVDVIFNMTHCIYSAPSEQIQLTTNEDGKIDLGALDGIKQIDSKIYLTTTPITSNWQLSNGDQRNTFPEKIEVLQNEELEFPFIKAMKESEFSEDTFSLIRVTFNKRHIENMFHMAKYTKPKPGVPSLVTIKGLEAGYYQITFKECNISTFLTVHDGEYWKDESFILKKNTLTEFKTNKRICYAKVKKVKQNLDNKKDGITLKLCHTNGNVRAHVITSNFISSNDSKSFSNIKDVLQNSITTEKFRLSEWKNVYLSNRKLGDEFRYVFDRKYRKSYRGNSLEKPHILLKRMKIRDTSFEEEVVKLGDTYKELAEGTLEPIPVSCLQVNIGGKSAVGAKGPLHTTGAQRQNRFRPRQQTQHHMPTNATFALPQQNTEDNYKSYLNFLKYSGIVKANLKPDSNNNISFKVPSGKYTNLFVIIADLENVIQVQIDLPSRPDTVSRRDLALTKPLDPKKHYNEVRNVINLLDGQKYKIKDITSVDYNIID